MTPLTQLPPDTVKNLYTTRVEVKKILGKLRNNYTDVAWKTAVEDIHSKYELIIRKYANQKTIGEK